MTETQHEKLDRLAEQTAVATADTLRWRITDFGRHVDGYFHARVTRPDGGRIYVHLRYGSWLVPGTMAGRAVLKETEALGVPFDIKAELARRVRATKKAERKADDTDQDDSSDDDAAEGDPVGEASD